MYPEECKENRMNQTTKKNQLERTDIQDIHALSPVQEGMLYHYRQAPTSENYHEQLILDLEGEISARDVEAAWNDVIATNEMLRVRLRWEKLKEPIQVILKEHRLKLRQYDLTGDSEIQHRLERIVREDRREVFDLAAEIPFRITLIDVAPGRSRMIVTHHHILYDGWSTGIVVKEFLRAYENRVRTAGTETIGRRAIQKKAPYKEHIRRLQAQDREAQKRYWSGILKGFETVTEIPLKTETSPQSADAVCPAIQRCLIPENLQGKIETAARERKITAASQYYAAWGLLLQNYADTDDVVFGTTVSGRTGGAQGIREQVGLFINTVPMRVRTEPGGRETIRQLLQRVNTSRMEREPYETTPPVDIASAAETAAELYDTVMVIENYPLEARLAERSSSARLRIVDTAHHASTPYTLTVGITRHHGQRIEILYDRQSINEQAVQRLLHHYIRLLEDMTGHPEKTVSQLDMLGPEEKKQQLEQFNAPEGETEAAPGGPALLHALFEEQKQKSPDHAVLEYGEHTLTYSELNRRADSLAGILRKRGVHPDTCPIVAVALEPSIETSIIIYAVLKAGGAYLPVDPNGPRERLEYILKDSNAKLLIRNKSKKKSENGDPEATVLNFHHLKLEKSSESETCPSKVSPSSLAYVIYTSGTTGRPKGVMVEHRCVVNTLSHRQQAYGMDETVRSMQMFSYTFDGYVTSHFTPQVSGGRVHQLAESEMRDIPAQIRRIIRHRITHYIAVPSLYRAQLEQWQPGQRSALRAVTLAGEAVEPGLLEQSSRIHLSVTVYNEYGVTEAAVMSTIHRCTEAKEQVSIGRPIPATTVIIRDRYGRLQPVGVPGEMVLGGAGVARGYQNRPELTAAKFIQPQGTQNTHSSQVNKDKEVTIHSVSTLSSVSTLPKEYKTGDRAQWNTDGSIRYLGRRDHQVKLRGYRIELQEIEAQLQIIPGITAAVVIAGGRTDAQSLRAYYRGPGVSVETVREHLNRYLPAYQVPPVIVALEEMPRTASGKIDRRALPEPENLQTSEKIAPRNNGERRLAQLWAEQLNIDPTTIGIDDNYFHKGGHSLTASRLASLIHRRFDVPIPIEAIYKRPTVRQQYDYIKKAEILRFRPMEPVEEKEYYPLSPAQHRLYILHRMNPEGTAYNLPACLRLEGQFSLERCRAVFRRLIQVHESLRTAFVMHGPEPVQRIHDRVDFDIEVTTGEETNDLYRPFDLERPPLMRVAVTSHSSLHHTMNLDMHHIITDGTSTGILIKAFMEYYEQEGNEQPPLEPVIRYRDYSEWWGTEAQQEVRRRQEDYWLRQYGDGRGVPSRINLPFDRPAPEIPIGGNTETEGGTVHFEIDEPGTRQLMQFVHRENVTLYQLLLAAFGLQLVKLGGEGDIVVGTPVEGRRRPELQGIIGFFVNTLALRLALAPEHTVDRYLKELRHHVQQALENQEYPFENLVDRVADTRDNTRNPLFDVLFVLENMEIPLLQIPGLKLTPEPVDTGRAKFDLSLIAEEQQGKIKLVFEYNAARFLPETIQRYAAYYRQLVEIVITKPHLRIEEIDIRTPEEKQRFIFDVNATTTDYPSCTAIPQLFEQQVEKAPHRIAAVGTLQLTYAEMNRRIHRLAAALHRKGVCTGDIVALKMNRSVDMLIAIMGILKAGAAYLPIETGYPRERIDYMLKDSDAKILLEKYDAPDQEAGTGVGAPMVMDIEHLNYDRIDTPPETEIHTICTANVTYTSSPTSLAYVIYTSGTTGRPKGVLTTHRNVVRVVKNTNYIDITPLDRLLQLSNYAFDGSVFDIYGALLNGAVSVITGGGKLPDQEALGKQIRREQITVYFITTSLFNLQVELDPGCHDRVRKILVGGEKLSLRHIREAYRRQGPGKYINAYGPTEATVFATYHPVDNEPDGSDTAVTSVPIGRPIANTTVFIMDRNNKPVPQGVPGELYIGGDGIAKGYMNRPELTAEKFIKPQQTPKTQRKNDNNRSLSIVPGEATLYKTGDLVRWLQDGRIEYLDRIDRQVKIRGYRIELEEIENRIRNHPEIKDTVVIVHDFVGAGNTVNKEICAYIIPADEHPWDREKEQIHQLNQYMALTLPEYMIPTTWFPMKSFPLNANGKIDRSALPSPTKILSGHKKASDAPPVTESEKLLHAAWIDVMGKSPGIDDDFFRQGGNSLQAMRLTARIKEKSNIKLPLSIIFREGTIRNIARRMDKMTPEQTHHTEKKDNNCQKNRDSLNDISTMDNSLAGRKLRKVKRVKESL
jgi:tyrocidine synthetase III